MSEKQTGFIVRILKSFQRALQYPVQLMEGILNKFFGPENNPLYYLGALTFFFMYIAIISGVVVLIFYDTEVSGAYASVEKMTHEQWYFAGIWRSLHRYASDGMILAMFLHLMRRFINDRYNGGRSFSWVTGVPMIWMVFITGLLGYWIVWDQLAQFIAVRAFEWVDWLPIIAQPSARNFLTNEGMSDTFFRLMLITHLGLPLFLGGLMLVHTNRLHHPKTNPPKKLAIGTVLALLVLSIAKPAVSHAPADLAVAPSTLNIDWFYMFPFWIMGEWGMEATWVAIGGGTLFAFLLPWLPPKKREPVAIVDLPQCSGCNLCVDDCPYEAIRLELRTDEHPRFKYEAQVIADKCVSCGICMGSCPYSTPFRKSEELQSAIEMPHFGLKHLKDKVNDALQKPADGKKIMVIGCSHGVGTKIGELDQPGVVSVNVECSGMLPPSFIDYALRNGADGVCITGCREGDCYHRLGNVFFEKRLTGDREPVLHQKVDRDRVKLFLGAKTDKAELAKELEEFGQSLPARSEGSKQSAEEATS